MYKSLTSPKYFKEKYAFKNRKRIKYQSAINNSGMYFTNLKLKEITTVIYQISMEVGKLNNLEFFCKWGLGGLVKNSKLFPNS